MTIGGPPPRPLSLPLDSDLEVGKLKFIERKIDLGHFGTQNLGSGQGCITREGASETAQKRLDRRLGAVTVGYNRH